MLSNTERSTALPGVAFSLSHIIDTDIDRRVQFVTIYPRHKHLLLIHLLPRVFSPAHSGEMSSPHRRSLEGQRSDLLVLSAVILASSAIHHQVSAVDTLHPSGDASLQQDPVASIPRTHPHLRQAKTKARLPIWAYDPPPASLDRNLHQDRFAQSLKIQHTPPDSHVPIERPSEVIDEDDGDEEHNPCAIDPNYRPVPTKWLMLGYSRVADIPEIAPTQRMTPEYLDHDSIKLSAATPLDLSTKDMTTSCATARGSNTEWLQSPRFQLLGAVTLFLMVVFVVESARYLLRLYDRKKALVHGRGELGLKGEEKQLRAYAENIG